MPCRQHQPRRRGRLDLHRSDTPPEARAQLVSPEISEEERARREAERLHREDLTAAGEARRRFLCKLLTQRIAKGEVLHHVALVLVELGGRLAWEDHELAWGLLDVAGQEIHDGGDAHEALKSTAARGPEEAAWAALAFAVGEGFLDATWRAERGRGRLHLEFLQRHGYVLSDAER